MKTKRASPPICPDPTLYSRLEPEIFSKWDMRMVIIDGALIILAIVLWGAKQIIGW